MNSTSGTEPMAIEKALSCGEVCGILKACGEAKVTKLKFRDLEVEFDQTVAPPALPVAPIVDRPPLSNPVAEITDSQHEKQSKASLEQAEIVLREAQIAELQITDPLAAEELIRNGELEEEDERDEDGT